MSDDCEFPGCENDATATYCPGCRGRVRGAAGLYEADPLGFVLAIVITVIAIAAVAISVLMYWRVI